MDWKHLLAYITGSVDEELLLRNEYLVTENRILRQQITGCVSLSDGERKTLAEIGKRLGKQALAEVATIVKPDIILALGATAVRSVSGRPFSITEVRGRIMPLSDGGRMLATIHPSYILRIDDGADKRAQYKKIVADLKVCAKELAKAA